MSKFTRLEIAQLFKKARRVVRHPSLDILAAPTTASLGRLLVVTSRAVGNAPERNKLRRRFKAIFYEEKLFERQFDCIIITKKPLVAWSYQELKDFLIKTFEQLKRYKQPTNLAHQAVAHDPNDALSTLRQAQDDSYDKQHN